MSQMHESNVDKISPSRANGERKVEDGRSLRRCIRRCPEALRWMQNY